MLQDVLIVKVVLLLDSNNIVCLFEILLSFFTTLYVMRRYLCYAILLITTTALFITQFTSVTAYDDLYGVEYDDIIDIAFISYINGEFSNNYTADGAFRVTVNSHIINAHLIDQLIGMKIGESKPYITWVDGEENLIEYYDTTIVRLIKDATPDKSIAWKVIRPILLTIASLAIVLGGAYAAVKISKLVGIKGCSTCNNKATSKCSKCGTYYCPNCSSKGCKNCGSRQFVRL